MKESIQRKLLLLLLVSAIISLLWAIGSNSRKKVELVKSGSLESKLEKLIQANSAIVNDLKETRNRLSTLAHSERILKKSLAIETEKNEAMKQTIEKATTSAMGKITSIEELAKDAESLKNTNLALGEELLVLKTKDAHMRTEIEKLRAQLAQTQQHTSSQRRRKQIPTKKGKQEEDSSNKNYNWQ